MHLNVSLKRLSPLLLGKSVRRKSHRDGRLSILAMLASFVEGKSIGIVTLNFNMAAVHPGDRSSTLGHIASSAKHPMGNHMKSGSLISTVRSRFPQAGFTSRMEKLISLSLVSAMTISGRRADEHGYKKI